MDEGPGGDNDSIDEEGLFDAVFEDVAEEHDAHIGCEEAPIRLPSNPSDPTPAEREKHNKTHLPRSALVLGLRAGASAQGQALHGRVCGA